MLTLMKILHPGLVIESLQRIDAEFPSWTMDRPQALRRTFVALGASCTCLLLLNYLQPIVVWHFLLSTAAKILDMPSHTYLTYLKANGWLTFSEYLWWGFCHFLTLLLLPCFLIRRCFKEKLGDYGMHWNDVSIHFIWYAALLALIVFFVICVSFGRDFVNHYPFYRLAGRSWLDFLIWESVYISQFVFLEFFFRGFMVNALRPAMGVNSIFVMCVPYTMIHFQKLPLEATGAIFFGLFLGILALRSRSIWGGVLVHAGVAVSMDVAALLRRDSWPQQFWPL